MFAFNGFGFIFQLVICHNAMCLQSGHIRYIRYLPQVLSLQHKVMHHFRNVDLQCYEDVPIPTFKKENIPGQNTCKLKVQNGICVVIWLWNLFFGCKRVRTKHTGRHDVNHAINSLQMLKAKCLIKVWRLWRRYGIIWQQLDVRSHYSLNIRYWNKIVGTSVQLYTWNFVHWHC